LQKRNIFRNNYYFLGFNGFSTKEFLTIEVVFNESGAFHFRKMAIHFRIKNVSLPKKISFHFRRFTTIMTRGDGGWILRMIKSKSTKTAKTRHKEYKSFKTR
jgi:hypothetical protein